MWRSRTRPAAEAARRADDTDSLAHVLPFRAEGTDSIGQFEPARFCAEKPFPSSPPLAGPDVPVEALACSVPPRAIGRQGRPGLPRAVGTDLATS
jgi:hypothetical protein